MELMTLPAADGLPLSIAVSDCPEPKQVLILVHGAACHKERYFELMEYLAKDAIACVAPDNRGHGASVCEWWPLGFMDGPTKLLEDLHQVVRYASSRFPGIPITMLGHSLGSLLGRLYLQQHDQDIGALVMTGTVAPFKLAPLGVALGKESILHDGIHAHSRLLCMVNADSDDQRWVSANVENQQERLQDPLCHFAYSNGGILTIFEADDLSADAQLYQCKNPTLPILSITGRGDIVTGGPLGLKESERVLKKAGYQNLQFKTMAHMRHEVLHEHQRQVVFTMIKEFLTSI